MKFTTASADFSQAGFPVEIAIDGDSKTGWAIQGPDPWNVNRTATFRFDEPVAAAGRTRYTVRLEQNYGGHHTLGRFRVQIRRGRTEATGLKAFAGRTIGQHEFNDWLDRRVGRQRTLDKASARFRNKRRSSKLYVCPTVRCPIQRRSD